jgi:hypothetical protein
MLARPVSLHAVQNAHKVVAASVCRQSWRSFCSVFGRDPSGSVQPRDSNVTDIGAPVYNNLMGLTASFMFLMHAQEQLAVYLSFVQSTVHGATTHLHCHKRDPTRVAMTYTVAIIDSPSSELVRVSVWLRHILLHLMHVCAMSCLAPMSSRLKWSMHHIHHYAYAQQWASVVLECIQTHIVQCQCTGSTIWQPPPPQSVYHHWGDMLEAEWMSAPIGRALHDYYWWLGCALPSSAPQGVNTPLIHAELTTVHSVYTAVDYVFECMHEPVDSTNRVAWAKLLRAWCVLHPYRKAPNTELPVRCTTIERLVRAVCMHMLPTSITPGTLDQRHPRTCSHSQCVTLLLRPLQQCVAAAMQQWTIVAPGTRRAIIAATFGDDVGLSMQDHIVSCNGHVSSTRQLL